MNQNKKAIIYCRVSTEDQAKEGLSVESQEVSCRRVAEEEGYSIIEVIKDEGKSGKDLKREGIKKVIGFVETGSIDAVFMVNTDRLSRNVGDHVLVTELFRKKKVLLRSITQPTLDNSATSVTMDLMIANFNQFHRLITAEKVKATMTEKAKAGYLPCQPPLGYKNITDDKALDRFGRKVIAINPITAQFIKKAFDLYANGNYNVMDVNDIVYEQGLRCRSGGKLADSRMYEILSNRFYIGELHWGDVHLTTAKHEALIDKDVFERVQKIMASNNKHSCRRRKFDWLLNGFIFCYKHGCRYTAEWHLNKKVKVAYYHCTNRSGCGKYFEQNKLESKVADEFKKLEFTKDFIDTVIEKAKNIFYEKRNMYDAKKSALINQRTAYECKRKTAEDKLFSKVISDDDFVRIRTEIDNDLQSIDTKLRDLEKERSVNIDIAREILNLTSNIYETYKNATPRLKKQLLGFFWERFEVSDGLIIKSVLGPLFTALVALEKAHYKTENPYITMDSNSFIKLPTMCAQ